MIANITSAIAESQQAAADLPTKIEVEAEAVCDDIAVEDNKICLHLPPPISKDVCIPLPFPVPSGTVARVCIEICYHIVPTGVCVIVTVLGKNIKFCFGWC